MFCPKCGNKVQDNVTFCADCGASMATPGTNKADSQPVEQSASSLKLAQPQPAYTAQSQTQVTQEDLVKAYIGGNNPEKIYKYLKITNPKIDGHPEKKPESGGFSRGVMTLSGIFGIFYFLYRKMYLMTVLILALSSIVMIVVATLKLPSPVIAGLVFALWSGLFPFAYSYDITRKINKIKNKYVDSPAEQLNVVKKAGGTSWPSVLLAIPYIALNYFFWFMVI